MIFRSVCLLASMRPNQLQQNCMKEVCSDLLSSYEADGESYF